MSGEPPVLTERVVRYLLAKGKVTPRQVEEARRTQTFFGGQLASHLLKLGFLDEVSLGEAMTEVSSVPYASGEQLRAISAEALAAVPHEMLERHRVCPFRIEDRRLRVAMLNPRDARAITEIQTASGYPVEPWVTSEYRLYQALERYYRIRPEGMRSISLAPPSAATPPALRSAASEAEAPRMPSPVEIGLDGRPIDADVSIEDHSYYPPRAPWAEEHDASPVEPAVPPTAAVSAAAVEPAPIESVGVESEAAPERDDFESLEERLLLARGRDEMAAALMAFCSTRASRSALFAISRDGIRGVTGRGRGFEPERVRRVLVPTDSSTIFDTALKSRDFFFGAVPRLPANRDLYTVLGGKLPGTAMILPIVVKERTAALLYLDDEDRPMSHPDLPLMRRVAAKAGLAFEILLLRAKLRDI